MGIVGFNRSPRASKPANTCHQINSRRWTAACKNELELKKKKESGSRGKAFIKVQSVKNNLNQTMKLGLFRL